MGILAWIVLGLAAGLIGNMLIPGLCPDYTRIINLAIFC